MSFGNEIEINHISKTQVFLHSAALSCWNLTVVGDMCQWNLVFNRLQWQEWSLRIENKMITLKVPLFTWTSSSFLIGMDLTPCFAFSSVERGALINFRLSFEGAVKWACSALIIQPTNLLDWNVSPSLAEPCCELNQATLKGLTWRWWPDLHMHLVEVIQRARCSSAQVKASQSCTEKICYSLIHASHAYIFCCKGSDLSLNYWSLVQQQDPCSRDAIVCNPPSAIIFWSCEFWKLFIESYKSAYSHLAQIEIIITLITYLIT